MTTPTSDDRVNEFLARKRIAVSVIAGACPMMYGDGVDIGHTCMRWILKLTGGLPQ